MVDQPKTPEILALLIADDVRKEPRTGKHTIWGTYNHIACPSFPWILPTFILYLACDGSQGKVALKLHLVDAEQARPPVFELPMSLVFPHPAARSRQPPMPPTFCCRKQANTACRCSESTLCC